MADTLSAALLSIFVGFTGFSRLLGKTTHPSTHGLSDEPALPYDDARKLAEAWIYADHIRRPLFSPPGTVPKLPLPDLGSRRGCSFLRSASNRGSDGSLLWWVSASNPAEHSPTKNWATACILPRSSDPDQNYPDFPDNPATSLQPTGKVGKIGNVFSSLAARKTKVHQGFADIDGRT